MQKLIPNVLNEDDIKEILSLDEQYKSSCNHGPWLPQLSKVLDAVEEVLEVDYQNAYWNIERQGKGHGWHYDGCNKELEPNHMAWCNYSAVLLLSPPDSFKGGEFQYTDKESTEDNPVTLKDELYGSLFLYSSGADNDPLWHRATAHTEGERWMFLMFLKGKEKE